VDVREVEAEAAAVEVCLWEGRRSLVGVSTKVASIRSTLYSLSSSTLKITGLNEVATTHCMT